MANIFKTNAGWVKRLPDCNLGPFETKEQAVNAYKTKEDVKKVTKVSKEKKIEKLENVFSKEDDII